MHRAVETICDDPQDKLLFYTLDLLRDAMQKFVGKDVADGLQENVDYRYVTMLMHPETGETRTAEEWGEGPDGPSGLYEVRWDGSAWKAVGAQ